MAEMDIIGILGSQTRLIIAVRCIGYGLVLASFIAFFVTLTHRKIVKRLLDAKALSRESALEAEEIGAKNAFCRAALRDKATLRKTVAATEAAEGGGKRYFIPEEKALGAEIRYVKRNSPVGWIVGMALLAAATEGAVFAIPWILSLFN